MTLKVFFRDLVAGYLKKGNESSYLFYYDEQYLTHAAARPISVNLPLRKEPFYSDSLFPFFDNLLVEGWLLSEQIAVLKINPSDRFALIAHSGFECIGAVSLKGETNDF